jgi:aldose 1-epimerase
MVKLQTKLDLFDEACKLAELHSEASGVRMEVLTDMPGLQLYSGNGIDEEIGKCWFIYKKRMG